MADVVLEDNEFEVKVENHVITNSVTETDDKNNLVSLTFKPGRIGMQYQGNIIIGVHASTQAADFGVKPGWRIEAVNSEPQPNDTDTIRDAILNTRDHDQLTEILFDKDPKVTDKKTSENYPVVTCTREQLHFFQTQLMQHRSFTHENLDHFKNKDNWKTVVISKKTEEMLGMYIKTTSHHAVVPGAVIHKIYVGSAAHKTGKLSIGDQIVGVNGKSLIGMNFCEIMNLIKSVSRGCLVTLKVVSGNGTTVTSKRESPRPEINQLLKNAEIFSNPKNFIHITLKKKAHEPLGMTISPTMRDAILPSVFISGLDKQNGIAYKSKQFQIGDQIMRVNGQSTVGLPYRESLDLIKGCAWGGEIEISVVRTKLVSTHILKTSSHKINISQGRIFAVDPSGEGFQAGLRSHMYIMAINNAVYYGQKDEKILLRLNATGTKEVICMLHVQEKDRVQMDFMSSDQFNDISQLVPEDTSLIHDDASLIHEDTSLIHKDASLVHKNKQNIKLHSREIIFQPGIQGVSWRGKKIYKIHEGSQAEKLGVQVGWRAFSINGQRIDKGLIVGDFIISLKNKHPHSPIHIVFQESVAIEELQEEINIVLEKMNNTVGKDERQKIYSAIKRGDTSFYSRWTSATKVINQINQLEEFHTEYQQLMKKQNKVEVEAEEVEVEVLEQHKPQQEVKKVKEVRQQKPSLEEDINVEEENKQKTPLEEDIQIKEVEEGEKEQQKPQHQHQQCQLQDHEDYDIEHVSDEIDQLNAEYLQLEQQWKKEQEEEEEEKEEENVELKKQQQQQQPQKQRAQDYEKENIEEVEPQHPQLLQEQEQEYKQIRQQQKQDTHS